ncbi:hypothetical protein [Leucobacter tenebrionis]|uniref:hypothetical protein n=1 Tax=Leucobacter tenebrionis TaxID=2873270 RepID=UPI001CA65E5C|nr:hypothetical protein [Leucobacter tenebrionis]QZY52931.1 hypothetical protein KVY00_05715 [Leucobacter tenebrionis]
MALQPKTRRLVTEAARDEWWGTVKPDRGLATSGTDLNQLYGASDAGAYALNFTDAVYHNLPEFQAPQQNGVLVVLASGLANASAQFLIVGTQFFFRESLTPGVWNAWRTSTTDVQVSSIVASSTRRGVFAGGGDLNTLSTSDYWGSWSLPTGASYTNLPDDVTGGVISNAATLLAYPTGNRYSAAHLLLSGTNMWFREALDTVTPSWGAWQKIVTTNDATYKAIPLAKKVYDPYTAFKDGEVLYVLDRQHCGNEWDGTLANVGYTTPAAWTLTLSHPFPDGNGVEVRAAVREFGRFLWFNGIRDAESLVRMEVGSFEGHPGGAFQRYSTGSGVGYFAGVTGGADPTLQISYFTASSVESLASVPVSGLEADTPFNVRFRVEGKLLSASAWKVGQTEPKDWQLIAEDTRLVSGDAGVGVLQSVAPTRFNSIIVNSGGGRA